MASPASDETKRKALIAEIRRQGSATQQWSQAPLVSLEMFFDGNEDPGSIGPNLVPHPGLSTFFETLLAVREREDVQGVWVAVTDVEEETEGMWPFSDVVYILTSASAREVEGWLEALRPDEAVEVPTGRVPGRLPDPLPGHKVLLAWWD